MRQPGHDTTVQQPGQRHPQAPDPALVPPPKKEVIHRHPQTPPWRRGQPEVKAEEAPLDGDQCSGDSASADAVAPAEGSGASASPAAVVVEQQQQDGQQDWPHVEMEDGAAEVPTELWRRRMRMITDAIVHKDI